MLEIKKDNIEKAVEFLKAGKVIIFPTETSYGLGCDATNRQAVEKIYKIKNRDEKNPILILLPNKERVKEHLVWDDNLEELSSKFWPGPLTIVGEYKGGRDGELVDGAVSSLGTVAVRVSNNLVANLLSEKLAKPLVATSANISGRGEIYDPNKIKEEFEKCDVCPDMFLNFGVLKKEPPTTVVSLIDGEIKILRQGKIKI